MIDRGLQTKEGEAMSGYLESGEKRLDSHSDRLFHMCLYCCDYSGASFLFRERIQLHCHREKSLFPKGQYPDGEGGAFAVIHIHSLLRGSLSLEQEK